MDWVEDLHQARVRHGQIRNSLAHSDDWWSVHTADKQMPSTKEYGVEAYLTQVLSVDLAAT